MKDNSTKQIIDEYITTGKKINVVKKMERNLQAEVGRIKAVKDSISGMNYISSSEAKRLLFEIEALKNILEELPS